MERWRRLHKRSGSASFFGILAGLACALELTLLVLTIPGARPELGGPLAFLTLLAGLLIVWTARKWASGVFVSDAGVRIVNMAITHGFA